MQRSWCRPRARRWSPSAPRARWGTRGFPPSGWRSACRCPAEATTNGCVLAYHVANAPEGVERTPMAKGRHIAKRRTRAIVIVAVAAAVIVLALGGAAYSAYHYEQERSDTILPGVTVGG